MLKSGYWLFEFLPISRVLVSAPARYARAFLYTETDSGDVTYFNRYHLNVILRAINDLHDYLEREQIKLREAEKLLESFHEELNYRQRALISHALKHPNERYTARLHEGKHHVTYATARTDLMELEKLRLLKRAKKEKGSKEWMYYPAENLIKLLNSSKGQKEAGKPTLIEKEIPQKAVVATVLKKEPLPQSLFDGIE
jgi:Fic family protein